jgi:glycogen phosphorylase
MGLAATSPYRPERAPCVSPPAHPVLNKAQPNAERLSLSEEQSFGKVVERKSERVACNAQGAVSKFAAIATKNDFYMALAYTVRDRQLQRWINTENRRT